MLKNKKVTIKEDLTKTQLILYQQASEKYGFKNTWSIDGKIMVFANNKKQSYMEYNQNTQKYLISNLYLYLNFMLIFSDSLNIYIFYKML